MTYASKYAHDSLRRDIRDLLLDLQVVLFVVSEIRDHDQLLQAEKELIDPKKTDVDVTVAPLEPPCCGVHELSYEVTLV